MSRSLSKLKLQKDQIEFQQRRFQSQKQSSLANQSSAIRLPDTSAVLSSSVPGEVFQVQTSLQHPTRYHVQQKQRDQVATYLSQSAGNTKVVLNKLLQPRHDNLTGPSSAPGGPGASAPASPLARLNLSTSADQVTDYDIIDDLVQLESTLGGNAQFSSTLPTIDRNTLTIFNATPAANLAVYDQSKTSSSCPPEIVPKQEYMEDDRVNYLQDRVKKDNHNRIERRRRYNINDRIKELGTLIPRSSDPDMRWNKGSILKAAVDHMRELQSKIALAQQMEKSHQEMKVVSKRLLLRIQDLELSMKSHGLEIPPMQEQQEIMEAVLKPDPHIFNSAEFSREEEYEVANFPSQTVSNALLGPGLKQEKISPSPLSLQPNIPSIGNEQHISPANYQNHDLNQMQHIPGVVGGIQQLQYNQDPSGDIIFTSVQDQAPLPLSDPLMTYPGTVQSFSNLLNQPEDITFEDVMMEEDPIRTDIFLSDALNQS